MRTLRNQKIRTKARSAGGDAGVEIGGWLSGRHSYIWIGEKDGGRCLGWIADRKLYRLAKAIVRRYENAR